MHGTTDTVILGDEYGEGRVLGADLVAELEQSLAGNRLALPSLPRSPSRFARRSRTRTSP